MKNKKLVNYLCLSGLISILFYLLHDIIGSINYDGYNWMKQAVSDLTATDSPSFATAIGYVTVFKILNIICCISLCILMEKEKNRSFKNGIYLFSIMNFISAIGYALFPLSSSGYDGSIQSFIHVYVITGIVIITSIVSFIMIANGAFRDNPQHKSIGIITIICLLFMFFGAALSANVSKEIFGLVERFSTYSVVIYTGILGFYGYKDL